MKKKLQVFNQVQIQMDRAPKSKSHSQNNQTLDNEFPDDKTMQNC